MYFGNAESLHATTVFFFFFSFSLSVCLPAFADSECEWFLYMPFLNARFSFRLFLFFFFNFSVLVAAAVAGFFLHIIANSNWIIILNCYAGSAIASRWYVTSHRKLHTPEKKRTMERTKNCDNNDNDLIASNKDEDHIICSVHSFRLATLQFRKSNLLKWDTRSCFPSFVRLLVTKSWLFCNSWLWLLTLKAERELIMPIEIWKCRLKSTPFYLKSALVLDFDALCE